jgi:hypothetical protein
VLEFVYSTQENDFQLRKEKAAVDVSGAFRVSEPSACTTLENAGKFQRENALPLYFFPSSVLSRGL